MTPALRWSWALRWIIPPTGEEKVFAIVTNLGLRANFDESGIHDHSGWCVVGGLVGTVGQWERFEAIWGPYGLQTPFHAREFFSFKPPGGHTGPYEGWSDKRARGYFSALLQAIGAADITPIVSAIDKDAFWRFPREDRERMTSLDSPEARLRVPAGSPDKPYFIPYGEVILRSVISQEKKYPGLSVYFLFDRNPQLSGHALQVYKNILERAERLNPSFADRMGDIVFGSYRTNLGLQAADLLAYTWHRRQMQPNNMCSELCKARDVFSQKPDGDWAAIWTEGRMREQLLTEKDEKA